MSYRRYDDLRVGQTFPDEPALFPVDADRIRSFRAIPAETIVEGSASDDAIAPPMLAAVYIRPAQNALNGPPGGVHAKQQFRFHEVVRAGDVLATTLTVEEKYERKGRRYLVSRTRTVNQDDVLVTTGRITSIWGKDDA